MLKNSGTFGLMDREVVENLRKLPEQNLFLPALRQWIGFKQDVVWYHRRERDGKPTQTYVKLFQYAWDGITSFSELPLRLISVIGLAICIFGFGYALFLIAEKIAQMLGFFKDLNVLGFTTIAVAILCLGGIQLVCLGILGEYLAKIYREVKGRPHYIVQEIINK